VALVTLEAIARVALAHARHEAVACHLGDNRGGCDGRARRVSVHDQLVRGCLGAERKFSVHEAWLCPLARASERPPEAGQVGVLNPDPVYLARGEGDERHDLRVREDGGGEALAFGTRQALRVVQLVEEVSARAGGEALQVEENACGHDRSGSAGAPHLIDAGDQANAASEVVGKEG
jgi:hypothetical protein